MTGVHHHRHYYPFHCSVIVFVVIIFIIVILAIIDILVIIIIFMIVSVLIFQKQAQYAQMFFFGNVVFPVSLHETSWVINLRLLSSQTVSMAGQIVVNVSWLLIMMVLLANHKEQLMEPIANCFPKLRN